MNYYPNFSSSQAKRPVTRRAEPPTMGEAAPEVMRRAFFQLRNGRPGPVPVEIPRDVFDEVVPEPWEHVPSYSTRTAPDPGAVEEAAAVLAAAERPVIYAGQGVHYAEAWGELKALAEAWSIPVSTSLEGKSAFPETHPLSLGSGGRANPRAVTRFLAEADVILGVGCSFAPTVFGVRMPPGKTIIHATLDPMDLNKDIPAQHALIGDAKLSLAHLTQALEGRDRSRADARKDAVPGKIAKIKAQWLAEWDARRNNNEAPLSPYRVLNELRQTVVIDNTIITHDAGSPRDQLSPFWETTTPLSHIGWDKTTQPGYGLGLAMGAKLARPDKLCINVWGDAAIGFSGMDFETAVRERIPILSVLMNNATMAIELHRMQASTEKYRATDISANYAGVVGIHHRQGDHDLQ